jgi:hypothetical protein
MDVVPDRRDNFLERRYWGQQGAGFPILKFPGVQIEEAPRLPGCEPFMKSIHGFDVRI